MFSPRLGLEAHRSQRGRNKRERLRPASLHRLANHLRRAAGANALRLLRPRLAETAIGFALARARFPRSRRDSPVAPARHLERPGVHDGRSGARVAMGARYAGRACSATSGEAPQALFGRSIIAARSSGMGPNDTNRLCLSYSSSWPYRRMRMTPPIVDRRKT